MAKKGNSWRHEEGEKEGRNNFSFSFLLFPTQGICGFLRGFGEASSGGGREKWNPCFLKQYLPRHVHDQGFSKVWANGDNFQKTFKAESSLWRQPPTRRVTEHEKGRLLYQTARVRLSSLCVDASYTAYTIRSDYPPFSTHSTARFAVMT